MSAEELAPDVSEQQLDCALDLMRRLPPQQIEKNLSDLIDLVSRWAPIRPFHILHKLLEIVRSNRFPPPL
ncbi:F-actin-capping protein subunit beta, partial [Ophiophagus hannah]